MAPGQILAEVETDKATIEWEAQEEGFMAKHLVPEGARDIAVGTPVAVLSEEADGVAGLASFTPGASSSSGGSAPAAQATEPKAAAAAAAPAKPAATLPPHQVGKRRTGPRATITVHQHILNARSASGPRMAAAQQRTGLG